jgi:broad specificity phosphatase PhoE
MKHYVVRHAEAGNRQKWKGPDEQRPLSPKGRRQAKALAEQLADDAIERIWSSPFLRCVQTVEQLAERLRLPVEVAPELGEGTGAVGVLKLARNAEGTTVMCTHGDVMDALLDHLVREGLDLGKKPRCAKGSTWVLDVSNGKVVGATYLRAPG